MQAPGRARRSLYAGNVDHPVAAVASSRVDVTVVTATRNRPDHLRRAMASVARQTLERIEVFAIDDGSDAEHAEGNRRVLAEFDHRFTLIQPLQSGELGRGPAASRNRGMAAGQGQYVAFLDDDDIWIDDHHLARAVEVLRATGARLYAAELASVRDGAVVFPRWFSDSEAGGVLLRSPLVHRDPPVHQVSAADFLAAAAKRAPHPDTIVVAREVAMEVGGFPKRLWFDEDRIFVMRVADAVDSALFSPAVVAEYRLPEGDANSLATSRALQHLFTISGAQEVQLFARSSAGRREARRIEAWAFRELGIHLAGEGRHADALRCSLQGFCAHPTLGAAGHAAGVAARAAASVLRGQRPASGASPPQRPG